MSRLTESDHFRYPLSASPLAHVARRYGLLAEPFPPPASSHSNPIGDEMANKFPQNCLVIRLTVSSSDAAAASMKLPLEHAETDQSRVLLPLVVIGGGDGVCAVVIWLFPPRERVESVSGPRGISARER